MGEKNKRWWIDGKNIKNTTARSPNTDYAAQNSRRNGTLDWMPGGVSVSEEASVDEPKMAWKYADEDLLVDSE